MAESTKPATRRRSRLGSRIVVLVLLITLPLAVLSVINALYGRQSAAEDSYARTEEIVVTRQPFRSVKESRTGGRGGPTSTVPAAQR